MHIFQLRYVFHELPILIWVRPLCFWAFQSISSHKHTPALWVTKPRVEWHGEESAHAQQLAIDFCHLQYIFSRMQILHVYHVLISVCASLSVNIRRSLLFYDLVLQQCSFHVNCFSLTTATDWWYCLRVLHFKLNPWLGVTYWCLYFLFAASAVAVCTVDAVVHERKVQKKLQVVIDALSQKRCKSIKTVLCVNHEGTMSDFSQTSGEEIDIVDLEEVCQSWAYRKESSNYQHNTKKLLLNSDKSDHIQCNIFSGNAESVWRMCSRTNERKWPIV